MAKRSYYSQRYKVGNVFQAFKQMPEYRRGFKTGALKVGGKIHSELGNPQKTISGRKLVRYLKEEKGFSTGKIKEFFGHLSNISQPPTPKQKFSSPPPHPSSTPQPTPQPQKTSPKTTSTQTQDWMKEVGRLGIKFEKAKRPQLFKRYDKSVKFSLPSSSEVTEEISDKRKSQATIIPPPSQTQKSPKEILKNEKEKLRQYYENQKQNEEIRQKLDEKEKNEEERLKKIMEEQFKS